MQEEKKKKLAKKRKGKSRNMKKTRNSGRQTALKLNVIQKKLLIVNSMRTREILEPVLMV